MSSSLKSQLPLSKHEKISISEAARRCGWRRANTFRERFLSSAEDAIELGLEYDSDGRAVVDAHAVEDRVRQVKDERSARPRDWRIRNLGDHARPRPARRGERAEHGRKHVPPVKKGKSTRK